jgi:DNA-binding NarL/FixJ family response regulator
MTLSRKIRVLVVDDHRIVCTGLRETLNRAVGIEVTGVAHSGEQAILLAQTLTPDVIVLDMVLPDMDGLAVVQRLRESGSRARVVALSAHGDERYVKGALAAGCAGYLLKDEIAGRIVDAIRTAAQGDGLTLSPRAAAVAWGKDSPAKAEPRLTARERAVLRLAARGLTNVAIGLQLGIKARTVAFHLETTFGRLGVKNRTEAVAEALRLGELSPAASNDL